MGVGFWEPLNSQITKNKLNSQKKMSDDKKFRMSKISVIIKEVDVEEDDNRPREVPIFDQTMSLLQMIKDKKEKERQAKKEEIIREMALAQKAKKGQKNENRLKQNFVPMPRTHDFGHKAVVST